MKSLTLRQLQYFDAIARHGHFGRAAEACAVTQPALSMQLKELEATLGTPLLERSGRHVRLSAFGEAALARARDALQAIDDIGDLARTARGELSGRLRIGVIPTIAPYLLPKILATLGQTFPTADPHVRETVTPVLLSEIADGGLDLAILALPTSEAALEEFALFEEPFLLVRPLAEAAAPPPDVEALRQMRLLLLEEGHCFRDQALAVCGIGASAPREVLDASSLSTLVQMVSAGIGVTLIPAMARDVETRSAQVAISHFGTPMPALTICTRVDSELASSTSRGA
ncbi:MAG: LysR substrate-binding domain-containing protein, partial [Pseudomonadota bacterium]